jgi:hypothetical protein
VPAADRAPKVADAGEDRVGRWIDERIDLAHIYAEIWKGAAPAHLVDVAVFCDSDDTHTGDRGGARREAGISLSGIASPAEPLGCSALPTYRNSCWLTAAPKVADAGEDRVGRWIDERIGSPRIRSASEVFETCRCDSPAEPFGCSALPTYRNPCWLTAEDPKLVFDTTFLSWRPADARLFGP